MNESLKGLVIFGWTNPLLPTVTWTYFDVLFYNMYYSHTNTENVNFEAVMSFTGFECVHFNFNGELWNNVFRLPSSLFSVCKTLRFETLLKSNGTSKCSLFMESGANFYPVISLNLFFVHLNDCFYARESAKKAWSWPTFESIYICFPLCQKYWRNTHWNAPATLCITA